ncbi:hypothetical protein [uncultured Rhodoblastus sp.]|uniref:hypothetical protein n=1 Tax=uncultured Rhodoblastus sp. TaxID=543037 RepID=UPI0025FB688F|nr:hypothetical protein [uncultured Rhodoblastus sp.]
MHPIFLAATMFLSLAPVASRAQMVLPGAVAAPTPAGQPGAPPSHQSQGGKPKGDATADRPFAPAKPPALDTIVGKPLSLSGSRGILLVEKSGADPRLSRLTLTGDRISQPNQSCEVTMGGAESLALKPLGSPDGVLRFELDSSACPIQFDVLNGALSAAGAAGGCSFVQADCRADGAGLWGPPGASFGEPQAKSIERERTTLENNVRDHFRRLLGKFKKDKLALQAAVKEQAAFSASRAQTCRDYDREDAHGFCALRLTEARDFRLQARLTGENAGSKDRKPAKPVSKPADSKPSAAKSPTLANPVVEPARSQDGAPTF